ncbi:MAG TPA: tRNA (adenosine(37)-N6)-threonylcarbamoyltransferase complex ATPase subunit type 1 TsaE [Sedimentisphaerales bacterium]|nr:tRNA (adenosine(37)-N6)-threonylcarbamoyltransferase complex ATPase subunit type 1 TsaE [Sedimentisphaerales bacterium]
MVESPTWSQEDTNTSNNRYLNMDYDFTSNSPEQTIEIGRKIGSQLKGAEVLAICGPLGSGKTHLIKGIAAGAGAADARQVNSPTFVIVNEYAGRLDIYHIDAYRLDSVEQFEMLGFDDFCYPRSVVLIEWGDKVESALRGLQYIRLSLSRVGRTRRAIHIENAPSYINL